jgi:hypothetical protein
MGPTPEEGKKDNKNFVNLTDKTNGKTYDLVHASTEREEDIF